MGGLASNVGAGPFILRQAQDERGESGFAVRCAKRPTSISTLMSCPRKRASSVSDRWIPAFAGMTAAWIEPMHLRMGWHEKLSAIDKSEASGYGSANPVKSAP